MKEDEISGTCGTHRTAEKCIQNFGQENLKGRDHMEDIGIDVKIILEWILWKYDGKLWTDSSGSGQGPVAGSCEDGNKLLDSIKGGEFLGQLSKY
jgi:hypothetical protein